MYLDLNFLKSLNHVHLSVSIERVLEYLKTQKNGVAQESI
jgi:hypothetical protein